MIEDMGIEGIVKRLSELEDPRRTDRGNIRHKLEDIIIIGLCTQICNGNDFPDMEEFGKEREEWLRKFLELPNGYNGPLVKTSVVKKCVNQELVILTMLRPEPPRSR